jgi:hypothetical protein
VKRFYGRPTAEIDARLWEIAENLHVAELTELERAEHVTEWIRLAELSRSPGNREREFWRKLRQK